MTIIDHELGVGTWSDEDALKAVGITALDLMRLRDILGSEKYAAMIGLAASGTATHRLFRACEDCLHQLSTDSDLDSVTCPDKYRALVDTLRKAINPDRSEGGL